MNLDCPSAFAPFFADAVRVVAAGAARADAADEVALTASVVAGNPYAQQVGAATRGEQWTVVFPASAWISPRRPTEGCVVLPDTLSHRWPRLTVQRVYRVGGNVALECSARERGRAP